VTVGIRTTRLFFFAGSIQIASRLSWETREISRELPSHFISVTTCYSAMGEVAASDEASVWAKVLAWRLESQSVLSLRLGWESA